MDIVRVVDTDITTNAARQTVDWRHRHLNLGILASIVDNPARAADLHDEIENRKADVDAEEAARIAAIADEASKRASEISAVISRIALEESARQALQALHNALRGDFDGLQYLKDVEFDPATGVLSLLRENGTVETVEVNLSGLGAAPANVSLSAEAGTGTDTTTPAVASATVASVLQTIWAKMRQVANVIGNHVTSTSAHTAANVGAAPAGHVGATGTAHGNATATAAGFMSGADKAKLDGISSSLNPPFDSLAVSRQGLWSQTTFPSSAQVLTIVRATSASGAEIARQTVSFTATTATTVTAFQAATFTMDGVSVTTRARTDTVITTFSTMITV